MNGMSASEPTCSHDRMKPKFYEDKKVPAGYYDTPDPYTNYPMGNVNLLELSRYVLATGRQPMDFTEQEMERFLI